MSEPVRGDAHSSARHGRAPALPLPARAPSRVSAPVPWTEALCVLAVLVGALLTIAYGVAPPR